LVVRWRDPDIPVEDARASARAVMRAVLENDWAFNMSYDDEFLADLIIFELRMPTMKVSVPYDVKAKPLTV
jgi:hypothetical protein